MGSNISSIVIFCSPLKPTRSSAFLWFDPPKFAFLKVYEGTSRWSSSHYLLMFALPDNWLWGSRWPTHHGEDAKVLGHLRLKNLYQRPPLLCLCLSLNCSSCGCGNAFWLRSSRFHLSLKPPAIQFTVRLIGGRCGGACEARGWLIDFFKLCLPRSASKSTKYPLF